jgi:hypothetical protein
MAFVILVRALISFALFHSVALAADCWRDTSCNGPSDAAFPGLFSHPIEPFGTWLIPHQAPGNHIYTPQPHELRAQDQSLYAIGAQQPILVQ